MAYDYGLKTWMSYFKSPDHHFNAALQDEDYIKSRHDFIQKKTVELTTSWDECEKQIKKTINDLEAEEKRLTEYRNQKKEKYMLQIGEDYKTWSKQTGTD